MPKIGPHTVARTGPLTIQIAPESPKEGRPRSIELYLDAVQKRLEAQGLRFLDGCFDAPQIAPEADLVWAPGLGNRRVPHALFKAGKRGVATIHGLQFLDRVIEIRRLGPRHAISHYLWRRRIRADWARLGPQIGAVVSVSETLKPAVSRLLRVPGHRIEVIPHGISRAFFRHEDATTASNGPAGDYILHVSQFSPVKNIDRMLAAYAIARDRIGLPFRIVSGGWPGDPATLPQGVEMTTELLSHDEVRRLMWGARAFLFPSLEESFGLPVLEAMAAGVPVVTSLGTGAGEVAGTAGLCVDPTSTEAIAEALVAAATNEDLRAGLITKGRDRAGGFDWDVTAARHLALFERIAGRQHAHG